MTGVIGEVSCGLKGAPTPSAFGLGPPDEQFSRVSGPFRAETPGVSGPFRAGNPLRVSRGNLGTGSHYAGGTPGGTPGWVGATRMW